MELLDLQRRVKAAIKMPIVVWYPSMRAATAFEAEVSDPFKSKSPSIFDAWDGALDENAFDYQAFFLWFRQQHGLAVEEVIGDKEAKIFEVVKNAICGIFGDESYIRELSFSWQAKTAGEIVLKKQSQKKNLKVAQLSAGEKTLFLLVADLARRLVSANPGSENPLKEGSGIVMIDEVGLHLHPSWQREIISRLKDTFENIQFIVTTHSPQLLQHVERGQIRLLENGTISNHRPFVKGRDATSILDDAFGEVERPSDYAKKLSTFYRLLENNWEEAEKILEELKKDWGETDNEIIRAQSYLDIY